MIKTHASLNHGHWFVLIFLTKTTVPGEQSLNWAEEAEKQALADEVHVYDVGVPSHSAASVL